MFFFVNRNIQCMYKYYFFLLYVIVVSLYTHEEVLTKIFNALCRRPANFCKSKQKDKTWQGI